MSHSNVFKDPLNTSATFAAVKQEQIETTAESTATFLSDDDHQEKQPSVALTMPTFDINPDDLLEVPVSKAAQNKFPPGCICLRVDSSATPSIATLGKVEAVLIDLGPDSNRTFVYRLSPCAPYHNAGSVLARESDLHLGHSCAVWARPILLGSGAKEVAAVVLGSYVRDDDTFYSVHDLERKVQYHGIPSSFVRFRSRDSAGSNSDNHEATSSSKLANIPTPSPFVAFSVDQQSSASTEAGILTKRREEMNASAITMSPLVRLEDRPLKRLKQSPVVAPNPKEHETQTTSPLPKSFPLSLDTKKTDPIPSLPLASKRKRSAPTTMTVKIPRMITADILKDAVIGKQGRVHKHLEASLRCSIKLRGHPFSKEGGKIVDPYILLTGSDDDREAAIRTLENILVEVVDKEDRGMFLYQFNKLNSDDHTIEKAVCGRLPSKASKDGWMAAFYFGKPPNAFAKDYGLFVGNGLSRLRALQASCQSCSLRLFAKSSRPHVFIVGGSADDVNRAYRLVEERWEWVKEKKRTDSQV